MAVSSGTVHINTASSWQGPSVFCVHTASVLCAILTTKFLLDFHIHSLFPFLVDINYHGLLFVRIHICEFNGTAFLKITHTVNSSNLFMSNQFPPTPLPFILLFHTIYISLSAGILFIYLLCKVYFHETLMARTTQLKGQVVRYKYFPNQAVTSNSVLVKCKRSSGEVFFIF